MDLTTIIQNTRAQIREGDTGSALRTILVFLENNPTYAEFTRTIQVLEANYNTAKQQELRGIVSFQDAQRSYNQINDALLTSLDTLSSGRASASSIQKSTFRYWILGGAVILAVGIGLGWWFMRQPIATATACPEFRRQGAHILILPFQNIAGERAKPEVLIQARIQNLSTDNDFPLCPEIMLGYDSEKINPDIKDARQLADQCDAEIVIWGLYEKGDDSLQLQTRFFIAKENAAGETGFQALKSVSNIREGKMFKSLDQAVFSICGMMAARAGNMPLALKWFEKIQQPDVKEQAILNELHERNVQKAQ